MTIKTGPEQDLAEENARLTTIIENLLYCIVGIGTDAVTPANVMLMNAVARDKMFAVKRMEAAATLGMEAVTNFGAIAKSRNDKLEFVESIQLFVFAPYRTNPPVRLDLLMEEFGIETQAQEAAREEAERNG